MTQDQFQQRYREFHAPDRATAEFEAEKCNCIGIDNDRAAPVEFPGLGWCLMLESAARFLRQEDILPKTEPPTEIRS